MKYKINWRLWHKKASAMLPITAIEGFVPRVGDHVGLMHWTMEVTMVVFHPFSVGDTIYVDVEMDAVDGKQFNEIVGKN